jgi:hypothetical protein
MLPGADDADDGVTHDADEGFRPIGHSCAGLSARCGVPKAATAGGLAGSLKLFIEPTPVGRTDHPAS